MRIFIRAYDLYMRENCGCAKRLVAKNVVLTEQDTPADTKLRVNRKYFESLIDLGFFDFVKSYADLLDLVLLMYLDKEAKELKKGNISDLFDSFVKIEMKFNKPNSNAHFHVRIVFASYPRLFCRNSPRWLIEEIQKRAVFQVHSAIRQETLRARIKSNLFLFFQRSPLQGLLVVHETSYQPCRCFPEGR